MQILDSYPLTPMQEGMLYQWQVNPSSGINIEQMVCTLPETIDPGTLRQAWQILVDRHPILRTAFAWEGEDQWLQQVWGNVEVSFKVINQSHLTPLEREASLKAFLKKERAQGFDLSTPHLMQVTLLQDGEELNTLVWSFHHIILDGRSFPLLLHEVFTNYESLLKGKPEWNPMPPPEFKKFVLLTREQNLSKAEKYWQKLLKDLPEQELPYPCTTQLEHPLLEAEQLKLTYRFSEQTTQRLNEFAQGIAVTVNTLLQAVWGLALSSFTASQDIVFGTVRACRYLPIEEISTMAALLINTVPFRLVINPEKKLKDWLVELRKQQLDAREFEATPLSKIREWCEFPSGVPILRTMLMVESQGLEPYLRNKGGQWENRRFELHEKNEFPLALSGYLDRVLDLHLDYNSKIYQKQTIQNILDLVVFLLESLPSFSEFTLAQLPTVTPSMHNTLLSMSSTHFEYPNPKKGLHELVADQSLRTPAAIAIQFSQGLISYQELNERANQLAHFLIAKGAQAGKVVGLCLNRSVDMIIAALGILKSGAAYAPLDPNYPSERLRWMVEDCEPILIISCSQIMPRIPGFMGEFIAMDLIHEDLMGYSAQNTILAFDPENIGIVIFTSGSTGRPKGVLLKHKGLVNHNRSVRRLFGIDKEDSIAQVSTINFDVSVEEIFGTLASGGRLVLPDPEDTGSMTNFLEFIEREQITILNLTTLLWAELVDHLSDLGQEFPSRIRLVVVGGERVTRTMFNTWLRVGGSRIRWINAYGPTEACAMSTAYEAPLESLSELTADPPIGQPIDNTSFYILDPLGRLLPLGVPGELYLGGLGVGLGYLKDPNLTEQRFLPDPFAPSKQERMYKTGDRCFLRDDGNLVYLNRFDHQIKLRGYRIEPEEVECVLRKHPDIQDGVVKVVTTPAGNKQLVAYGISKRNRQAHSADVLSFLKDNLPVFMRPVFCIILETFPRSPNGKIDRKALPDPNFWELDMAKEALTGINEFQKKIATIWEKTLNISPVKLSDDFFELGGDSLKAMTLSSKIEAELGRKIPIALLLNAPNLEDYTRRLQDAIDADMWAPLINIKPGSMDNPLFLVHSLGGDVLIYRKLAALINKGQAIFGLQMQGLDRKKPPHATIEECAQDFIQLIRSVKSVSPYSLAGFSSGGLVAFEMACQLERLGEQVAFLGLIDTVVPPRNESNSKLSVYFWLKGFLLNLPLWISDVASWNLGKILKSIKSKLSQFFKKIYSLLSLNPQDRDRIHFNLSDHFDADTDVAMFPKYRLDLMATHNHAINVYTAKPYQGSATLFRSRRQPLFSPRNLSLGWDSLVNGQLTVKVIQGSHSTLLDDPSVSSLAAEIVNSTTEQ